MSKNTEESKEEQVIIILCPVSRCSTLFSSSFTSTCLSLTLFHSFEHTNFLFLSMLFQVRDGMGGEIIKQRGRVKIIFLYSSLHNFPSSFPSFLFTSYLIFFLRFFFFFFIFSINSSYSVSHTVQPLSCLMFGLLFLVELILGATLHYIT